MLLFGTHSLDHFSAWPSAAAAHVLLRYYARARVAVGYCSPC
jgi:hypothetical protein